MKYKRYFKKSDDGYFECYNYYDELIYRCKILAFVFNNDFNIFKHGNLDYIKDYIKENKFDKLKLNIVYSDNWDIDLINYFIYFQHINKWYKNNFL